MNIKRSIEPKIEDSLFKGKIIVLYGPRQAGKTTLIKEIQQSYLDDSLYATCDEPDVRAQFTNATSSAMKEFIGNKKILFLDEAQRVENIGLSLKLLVDTFPDVQIVATGSSSFELANKINEPLTGRKREFFLPPLSVSELVNATSALELQRTLEQRLIFGMYPEVVTSGVSGARTVLEEISQSYLYKDILAHQNILHPDILEKLLRALALQIGQEVSYNELAVTVGVSRQTVERYVELLEKTFVIFRVGPLCRNKRKELGKLRKIYFFDTGVRNQLIGAFASISNRQDVGVLWENWLMSERYKLTSVRGDFVKRYFWRSYEQREIDYVEEIDQKLSAFEFKWQPQNYRPPKLFTDLYPDAAVSQISKENFLEFCGGSFLKNPEKQQNS